MYVYSTESGDQCEAVKTKMINNPVIQRTFQVTTVHMYM